MTKTIRKEMNEEVKKAYNSFVAVVEKNVEAVDGGEDKNYSKKYILDFDFGSKFIGPHGRSIAMYVKKDQGEKPLEKMTKAELIELLAKK